MKPAIIILSTLFCTYCMGQIGGNQLYGNQKGNNNYYGIREEGRQSQNKVMADKNSMNFHVNILNNVQATSFTITLGLNQEAKTVEACNTEINRRISRFKNEVKSLNSKESDLYVDFISQTKIYDYQSKVDENEKVINVDQKETGFEIKKNIILKVKDITKFDRLLEIASKYTIHNIVKVDYHCSELDAIYSAMLKEALAIAEKRKSLLSYKQSDWEETPVISIDFHHVQPGEQYQKYQAYESSDMSYVNDHYRSNTVILRQEQRKSTSFYFSGINHSAFDKIMNADTPVVGLQCVMKVTVSYPKKEPDSTKKQYHVITPDGQLKILHLD